MKLLDRLNQDWQLATEIHKLEARLWRTAQENGHKAILFTSAARNEGKSTTVAYLAAALALHPDRRILAVDLDFREPRLRHHYQIEGGTGFGPVIEGHVPAIEATLQTELPNLQLLLPDAEGEDPHLLLRTREVTSIFQTLRDNYDLILIDVPALIPVADAAILIPQADGVVLVAMSGRTTKPHLRRAREICLGMGANILGIVLGNLQESLPGYGGGGYYYGRQRDKSTPSTEPVQDATGG